MQLDASNYYLIRTTTGTSVLVRRGNGAPRIVSGGARYTTVTRPRRKSIVQWDGDDPYRMDVPIMLDGWSDNRSVENDVSIVNQLLHSQSDLVPPAQISIDGALPVKGAKWVVESIDWGDAVIWTTDTKGKGYRLRQDATLHVLQFVDEAVLVLNRKPGASFPYTVKVNDTMASIARKYGVTVAQIKAKNKIRDPKSIKTGQFLIIPPSIFGSPNVPQSGSGQITRNTTG